MKRDGTGRRRAAPYPVSTVMGASPQGHWLIAMAPAPGRAAIDTIAIPWAGGQPRIIGPGSWRVAWDQVGTTFYLSTESMGTLAIPVKPGELPADPAGGFAHLFHQPPKGSQILPRGDISPGPNPGVYAFVKGSHQQNLFRISLR
jgi:hypothetical protein